MSSFPHSGFISLLYSISDKPLDLWSKYVSLDGKIRRVEDDVLNGDKVIEITGPHNFAIPTSISCPAKPIDVLNIELPVLVFVIKNLGLRLKVEFQLVDKKDYKRKFSLLTYNHEKLPVIEANTVRIPLTLEEGWNILEINLQNLCRDVYQTDYKALQRIIVYPNCRVRRIYLQDRHYDSDETPIEMCQAFFDMYMLKWGIHHEERECQTEECYTGCVSLEDTNRFRISLLSFNAPCNWIVVGSLQSCELECFSVENSISRKSASNRGNLSSDQLFHGYRDNLKMHSDQEITINRNSYFPSISNLSVNIPLICDKQSSKNTFECKKAKEKDDSIETSMNSKEQNVSVLPVGISDTFHGLQKSQYLKAQIQENLCLILKNPSKNIDFKIKSESHYGLLDVCNDNAILKSDSTFISKPEVARKIQSEIIRISDNAKIDILETVPSFIEAEAKSSEIMSRNAVLTTGKAISKFLNARHSVNEKILKKLRDKGYTMVEVELSIYNSKNRRNSYGQGKLVKSQERSTDKGSGIKPTETVIINPSLEKQHINLCNEACNNIENELNNINTKHGSTKSFKCLGIAEE